jgi:O-antigen/teichoic acid export membrane protein
MRRLTHNSLIYLAASILPRLLGILLLPLYSHYLSPAEYGIFGLANTINQMVCMLMSFGLVSAVSRFYFDAPDEGQRRVIMGQITLILLSVSLIFLGLLEWKGERIFYYLTPEVSYSTYLRIVVWAAFLSMFAVVPLTILRSQERAKLFTFLMIGQAVLYHLLAIVLVLYFNYGVTGLLWSSLASTLALVPVYLFLLTRMVTIPLSLKGLGGLLVYSVPLIPHSIAGWVLSLSDRIILQHWVPLADVGVYSLGYTLGSSVQNVAEAGSTAWFPTFYRSRSMQLEIDQPLKLATYIIAVVCSMAIMVAVGSHHFIIWFLPRSYAGSERVILWLSMSGVFVVMYYIWSFSIHYSKRTWYLAAVTWTAALSNIGLNLVLIPRYGYIAAAFTTFLAYLVMAIMGAIMAYSLYPVPYEYRRWIILVITTLLFVGMDYQRPSLALTWDIVYSLMLVFGWPIALRIVGFYTEHEKALWKTWLQRMIRGSLRVLPR